MIYVSQFPSILLFIGYLSFWIELYLFKNDFGRTSYLATALSVLYLIILIFRNKNQLCDNVRYFIDNVKKSSVAIKFLLLFILFILTLSLYASFFPLHLNPELDCINYHYSIPRQHLIRHNFNHISWSVADLWLMPVQFSLSPYWFLSKFPNKFPQFLFLIAVIIILYQFIGKFVKTDKFEKGVLLIAAIVGSHGISIQFGTGMLDLIWVYLFFAFLYAFLSKNYFLSALNFAYLFWGKQFFPFQLVLIYIFILIVSLIYKNKKIVKINIKFLTFFILLSIALAGPFLYKSFVTTHTPLYPFGYSITMSYLNVKVNEGLLKAESELMKVKDSYGYGRNILSFIKHFFILAVPDKGVNNKFDYPLGLPYLLFLIPFFNLFLKNIKTMEILPWTTVAFWGIWWFTSQQSRWLYIPLILIFIFCLINFKKEVLSILSYFLLLSLFITSISFFRSNYHDFFKQADKVIRSSDLKIINTGKKLTDKERKIGVIVNTIDCAYADFKIRDIIGGGLWVITPSLIKTNKSNYENR